MILPLTSEGIDGAVLHTREHRHFAEPKFLSMWLRPRGPWQVRGAHKPRKPKSDLEEYVIYNFAFLSHCANCSFISDVVFTVLLHLLEPAVLLSVSQNLSSFMCSSYFIMVRF